MALGISVPHPLDWITGVFKDVALAPVNALANAIADGLQAVLKTLSTAWILVDAPNVSTSDGHGTPVVAFLQSELAPYVGALLVLSVLIGAARVMLSRQARDVWDVLRGLVIYVIVAGAGTATVGLLIAVSDEFSQTIIDHATRTNGFGRNLELLLAASGIGAPILVIILALFAVLISLAQIMLLVVRAGLLVLLVGLMPLAASCTVTETGRHWLRKHMGWALAFILYKPVASIIYAAAFQLAGSRVFHGDGVLRAIVGVSLMGMAVVALPALLRFAVPATSHVAVGAGGAGIAGLAGVASAMPSGAKQVPPMPHAPAVAGPSGATGAAGAAGAGGAAGMAAVNGVKVAHSTARSAAHRAMGHDGGHDG